MKIDEMLSQLEWEEGDSNVDYSEILETPRESGDGESKEASPHTSASEDDNQEPQQIAEGKKSERRKEKKMSRIPVRQMKTLQVEGKSGSENHSRLNPSDDLKVEPSNDEPSSIVLLNVEDEDTILEAPEGFRSLVMDTAEVGAVLGYNVQKLGQGEISGGDSQGESDEREDANEVKRTAPTSATMEIMHDIEDNRHAHGTAGVLEDNDQILGSSMDSDVEAREGDVKEVRAVVDITRDLDVGKGENCVGWSEKVYTCADNERQRLAVVEEAVVVAAAAAATTSDPSIASGVAVCAEASRCSRLSTTPDCTPFTENIPISVTSHHHEDKTPVSSCSDPHLVWDFRNGRLVFEEPDNSPVSPLLEAVQICNERIEQITALESLESDGEDVEEVLCSRELNKRVTEGRSRLKHLENKLKEAGITDEIATTTTRIDKNEEVDDNQNVVKTFEDFTLEEVEGEGDLEGGTGGSWCEFDVRQLETFANYGDSNFYVVYDELEESDEDQQLVKEMRGDGTMGADGDRNKHNPDRDNLKSLLKKPGRRDNKKNRVVFNETKNEFFDADYIILIREECDYDDEDDDGVCTCNDHEMVRLTCCEPNCNCNLYDGYSDPTPQSPKFAPPLEFVDAVTLSPPEGYKDMELGEQQLFALQQMARRTQQQRTAVCRDCSASHDEIGEESPPEVELHGESANQEAKEAEKTDQSQQTTPTTPPADVDQNQQQRLMENVTVPMGRERRNSRDSEDKSAMNPIYPPGSSTISGILKGGRLWKQHSQDNAKMIEMQQATDSSATSDEESNGNKRSVRFIESNENKRIRDTCDGADDKPVEEDTKQDGNNDLKRENINDSVSPESTEMTLTFKLGNHVLISNNSLKPNSAMRQLFPCSKPLGSKSGETDALHQYLVTSESLRAFEEAKRSKLPQIVQSDDTDDSIKKAIERNTLRRSLIRYEPRSKKKEQKTDNSLVERIKQLTCDVDNDSTQDIPPRSSPPGEEARKSPELNPVKNIDKSFSPSSSSTSSSNSSSVSSTYRKITDLFAKKEKPPDIQNTTEVVVKSLNHLGPAPDLGNTGSHSHDLISTVKLNTNNEARKQFLSTLAPLTACVTNTGTDEQYYHLANNPGDRNSLTSSLGTEYSLEDIDEGLKVEEDDGKNNAPDVIVGTPCASESGDELAMFVQQDAGRIERIKKKYQQDNNEEDDEHDDYGFNKRPSVRGIKPRFGTTTEILQQIQNQIQPPQTTPKPNTHISWPYYSEASLSGMDNNKSRNINHNVPQYQGYVQYRPTSLTEENLHQNCANQRCAREIVYKTNANHVHSPIMRIGGGCSEYYLQSSNRTRNGRPESPPPLDVAKNYHQTMVYIPYNHIENYQTGCVSPNPHYMANEKCYARVISQNQINTRYEPMYPQRMATVPVAVDDPHYQNMLKNAKSGIRPPYIPSASTAPHLLPSSRSESPLPGQFSTARATQTPAAAISTCNYYPMPHVRYRPTLGPITHTTVLWNSETMYGNKGNRHSFPAIGPRYPVPDNISLTDSENQYTPIPNGYRQTIETTFPVHKDSAPSSPTKSRFIERGVPEGAASVSPQDSTAHTTSTMTSPTSPQVLPPTTSKPLFYAMNV